MELLQLPNELLVNVIERLPVRQIGRLCITCSRLANFCDEAYWRKKLQEDYPIYPKIFNFTNKQWYQRIQEDFDYLKNNICFYPFNGDGSFADVFTDARYGDNYTYVLTELPLVLRWSFGHTYECEGIYISFDGGSHMAELDGNINVRMSFEEVGEVIKQYLIEGYVMIESIFFERMFPPGMMRLHKDGLIIIEGWELDVVS